MTNEFGKPNDTGQNKEDGTTFVQGSDATANETTDDKGITQEELEALRKRDEAAQAHIPDLESENGELRTKLEELESKLASATTLDGVLDRISKSGDDGEATLDQNAITQIVDNALLQQQTQQTQDNNWSNVMADLTAKYGDWKTADTKVQERAQELDIKLEDASTMARNNPKAFLQLFSPAETTTTDTSSGVRSGGSGQSVSGNVVTGNTRDAAFYNKMRKENPKLYWSIDNQAQYRRDIHSAT